MKKAFYILILRQIGNIGANEIVQISDQPKEGFSTKIKATIHLKKLMKKGDYPFDGYWFSFMIAEIFSKKNDRTKKIK